MLTSPMHITTLTRSIPEAPEIQIPPYIMDTQWWSQQVSTLEGAPLYCNVLIQMDHLQTKYYVQVYMQILK